MEKEKEVLPFSNRQLKEKVNEYFERCSQEGLPPTPSGLALHLGVRTFQLDDKQLFGEQKKIIGQALQRIEASMMEIMLTRGGVRGVESVLERIGESRNSEDGIRELTDEEIRRRLKAMMPGIQAAIGGTEEK